MSDKTYGQIGFEAYGEAANWTAYDGKPMPRWEDIRPDIKEKWEVACKAVVVHVAHEILDGDCDREVSSGKTYTNVVIDEAARIGKTVDSQQAGYILWEHTGFPSFWQIPQDGDTPEACLRTQVREFFLAHP